MAEVISQTSVCAGPRRGALIFALGYADIPQLCGIF